MVSPSPSPEWLTGLTDGEGTFTLMVQARGPDNRYRRIEFNYKVSLRADDFGCIKKIREVLGFGKFSECGKEGRCTSFTAAGARVFNGHKTRGFFVNTHEEIERVIAFFRQYQLQSKKARDFEIWAEAYEVFMRAVKSTPYVFVNRNLVKRRSNKNKRAPIIGTPRRKFKKIPEKLFARMERYSERLKTTRKFDPKCLEESLPRHKGIRTLRRDAMPKEIICGCGCGGKIVITPDYTPATIPRFLHGHGRYEIGTQQRSFEQWKAKNPAKICACGCGETIEPSWTQFRSRGVVPRFMPGHNFRRKA